MGDSERNRDYVRIRERKRDRVGGRQWTVIVTERREMEGERERYTESKCCERTMGGKEKGN